jgi:hypothetical protein
MPNRPLDHVTEIAEHKGENDEDYARHQIELLVADDLRRVAHDRFGYQNSHGTRTSIRAKAK